jgi:xylan 1,4-beta-xylosidase
MTWMQMGRPRYPNKDMIESLKQAAQPGTATCSLSTNGGVVRFEIEMIKNEVTLIELTAVNDESGSYIGLDDSFIGY